MAHMYVQSIRKTTIRYKELNAPAKCFSSSRNNNKSNHTSSIKQSVKKRQTTIKYVCYVLYVQYVKYFQ